MTRPVPRPGLVIRYSYLWHREAEIGREEGTKDRPCAVLLAAQDTEGRTRVYALPITHAPPKTDDEAVEIPATVKARLGLDAQRSWIVTTEANAFLWPGPDLRPLPGRDPESVVQGFLPPRLFRAVRDRFLARARKQSALLVTRTE